MEMRTLVDWTVRPHLLAVEGVADVNVFGGEVRQWQIQVDPEKLVALRPGAGGRASRRRAARPASLGTGFVEDANQHILIAAEGQPGSAGSWRRGAGHARGPRGCGWATWRKVVEAPAPSISAAAINGEPGVFLMVQGQLGANTRAVTLDLEQALAELEPLLEAEKITLHPQPVPARQLHRDRRAQRAARHAHRLGAGDRGAVPVPVQRRTAFICATAIPVSLLGAVLVLDYFGVGLNIMVLGGLAIALGEVVDDAIIDTENIFRRLRQNRAQRQPGRAAEVVLDASVEVRSSVVYATFIVALVFVPLLTLGGVAGKLFAPLGLAYILAILASLVVALTLTPALCYLLLAPRALQGEDPPVGALAQAALPRGCSSASSVSRRAW